MTPLNAISPLFINYRLCCLLTQLHHCHLSNQLISFHLSQIKLCSEFLKVLGLSNKRLVKLSNFEVSNENHLDNMRNLFIYSLQVTFNLQSNYVEELCINVQAVDSRLHNAIVMGQVLSVTQPPCITETRSISCLLKTWWSLIS